MPPNISILPVNVDDLLRCRGVESERVEFKASWDPATTGPPVLRHWSAARSINTTRKKAAARSRARRGIWSLA